MRHKAWDSGGKYALLLLLCYNGSLFATSSDSKISGFTCPRVIGFAEDLFFFSTLESRFKNVRIRCRNRRMCVEGSGIPKEKAADLKISGYV